MRWKDWQSVGFDYYLATHGRLVKLIVKKVIFQHKLPFLFPNLSLEITSERTVQTIQMALYLNR